ncbi:MAG: protein of unknown function DUF4199 [Idiomarinaceae bacterium HL-53]|nr:MAG: protein of unknown function DUF4199 [Idiomarinaceae bacterium HL-53]CUS49342.1 Protein of unknown function (DUF4199) [Idiomarinaceae bacterium HL-53]
MKTYQQEIKWGLVFCVALLLWALLERVLGYHSTRIEQHPSFTMIFAIVAISIYVLALRSIRAAKGGVLSYKDAFLSGLVITVVVAVLSPLMQWIVHRIISRNFFANAIEYAVSSGKQTQSEAEAYFNFSSYLMQSAIGALVMGVVTTAIVAVFVSRRSQS